MVDAHGGEDDKEGRQEEVHGASDGRKNSEERVNGGREQRGAERKWEPSKQAQREGEARLAGSDAERFQEERYARPAYEGHR